MSEMIQFDLFSQNHQLQFTIPILKREDVPSPSWKYPSSWDLNIPQYLPCMSHV